MVVDASVAVKWLVYEDLSTNAISLARSGNPLLAPRLLLIEVANALVRKAARGELSMDRAMHEYDKLPLFFDEIVSIDDVIPAALRRGCTLRHPIYDLIYLETARKLGARLVTADRRFAAKLAGTEHARYVTLLSDWQPE
nr:type II toxin-antitoxin system VapC family toxin [Rhodopseudomonas sp. WA056]